MKNFDIEISEKVAEEAGKQMNQLKKEIESNKDIKLSILQDAIQDIREQRKFLKSICTLLIILLFIIYEKPCSCNKIRPAIAGRKKTITAGRPSGCRACPAGRESSSSGR